MAVISELIIVNENILEHNNSTISGIEVDGTKYHFAKNTESTSICDNAVEEPIIDMQISGNSVQDGTPTPETPIEVESVGKKTSNLADFGKAKVAGSTPYTKITYDNLTGTLELTNTPNQYDYASISALDLGLEVGKTYYFGGDVIVSGKTTTNNTVVVFNLGTSAEGSALYLKENGTQNVNGTFTYTGQSNASLRLFFNYGSDEPAKVTFKNVYVSEVKNEFEPYGYQIPISITNEIGDKVVKSVHINEPLRKIGTYADTVDFKNKKVNRVVGEIVCKGTEEWELLNPGIDRAYYYLIIGDSNYIIAHNGLNTHFERKTISSSNSNVGYNATVSSQYNDSRILIRPKADMSNVTDINEWLEFLEEQYNNGTPMKMYYVLKTPIEETVNIPDISTHKGTNVFDTETSIKPSDIKINYWKQIGA